MLSFDDIKNNHQKVLDYLDETFFTDSTVTLGGDEYIKQSVKERLLQVVLMHEGSLFLDRDTEHLSKSMLRASLGPKDIDFILNASLKISGVTVNVADSTKEIEKDKEKADKMMEDKKNNLCSLETIIQIITDCVGTPRVSYYCFDELPEEEKFRAMVSGKGNYQTGKCLKIERPLKMDTNNIDLSKLDHEELIGFLQNSLDCDSNSILDLYVPIKAIDSRIETLLSDLTAVCDAAATHAVTAVSNSVSFTTDDPFKALFAGL